MSGAEALAAHLGEGVATTCLCWAVTRRDGVEMGFTDHDRDLDFEGFAFRAGTGMTARALSQVAGLAVDNSEAVGALSDAGISEADLRAGRYDGAVVRMWLVNWAAPEMRSLRFRGTLGEVEQRGQAFRVELRGLSEVLNRPLGRVIRSGCDAVVGDRRCGLDLNAAAHTGRFRLQSVTEGRRLVLEAETAFAPGWFEGGLCRFLDGAAAGLSGTVKADRAEGGLRFVELWEEPGAQPGPGSVVSLVVGCDGRAETCRQKFQNFRNFRGFPHVPDEDWVTASPAREVAAGG
ncbi:hypothetical protein C0V75_06995 [Tabrizicola sp. TH137]|uniref:DUF2163 domain-containing protein n=1 Tax=Tabrizicola sp. TH137 TaxID=2067452 RepID=UPI000C7A3047|nr:DUF2163 domain-containing protein [Tabrizicola sp. TH137]PLL13154.1 hypothetical protein C0V75_06995 [Tabrizicola sp. TH137]